MKRIICLLTAVIFVFALVSCSEDDNVNTNYPSRTAAFYGTMGKDGFYFKMNFTNNGATYQFTQATNGIVVTTIEDHKDNSKDGYYIFDGNALHILDTANKRYNTIVGNVKAQGFLFEGYTPDMFANPNSSAVEQFEDASYYCETFSTVATNGVTNGKNKYYFDGNQLKAVEIIEGGKTVMVMRFLEYSNEIPDGVYFAPPKGYKATTLQIEGSDIFYDDVFGK